VTLILIQIIVQSIGSTLQWLGFYAGIRTLPEDKSRRTRWVVGSAIVFAAWLFAIVLLASQNVFRTEIRSPGVPIALFATLAAGYLFLLSKTYRGIIAGIPQHWLIGIQAFRVLGGLFLIRYIQGQLPGVFAIPAGVGDVLTGIMAPIVAYWWYAGKPYARGAAIAWNLFGMADLINAVTIGTITGGGGGGIVFATVLIPAYGVPRGFLIHSYSLIGLLCNSSQPAKQTDSTRLGLDPDILVREGHDDRFPPPQKGTQSMKQTNRVREYSVPEGANLRRSFARKAAAGKDRSCHPPFCSQSV